jgi:aspartate ammonia-lyase
MRNEHDSLGTELLDDDAVYGIHTLRGFKNFPVSGEKLNPYLIKGGLLVKKAAAETNYKCGLLSSEKYVPIISAIDNLLDETNRFIELADTSIYNKLIVDPLQGGAGTSLNMNINEVIANTSLKISGKNYGQYEIIHPIDDVNLSQSTNDVIPTALKIAAITLLRELAKSYASLQGALQEKEVSFSNILKLGRTQYQDAVPIMLGQEFGAYAQAIARDRWRLYNGEERLRSVNLGGTAVGNSITADRSYVLSVNSELKKITGLPLAKGEDLIDATQNLDVFVEVHGLVKSGAVSLIKICNDLRFMSSGPDGGIGEIILPPMQAGSSIMPGKVNPVIPENMIQICELVKGHDSVISNLISQGSLELNPFIPMIAHLFLKSVYLLKQGIDNFTTKCVNGIIANRERCWYNLSRSSAPAASLIKIFGYDKVAEIVKESIEQKIPFTEVLMNKNLISENDLKEILSGKELNEQRTSV